VCGGILTQGKGKDANEGLEAYEEERSDEGNILSAVQRADGVSIRHAATCRCMPCRVSHVEAPEKRDRHLGSSHERLYLVIGAVFCRNRAQVFLKGTFEQMLCASNISDIVHLPELVARIKTHVKERWVVGCVWGHRLE
jgi:hypothetical protein